MTKRIFGATAILAAAVSLVLAAGSAVAADGKASTRARSCLRSADIQNTQIINDGTIRFHLRNGKSLDNKLTANCPGLLIENGFSYDASPNGDVCANLQAIEVLKRGTVCLLGDFVPSL